MMLGALMTIVALGHLATLGLVVLVQVMMFRELVNVRYRSRRIKEIPLFRTTQWGWFWTCLIYSYGGAFYQEPLNSLVKSRFVLQLLPYVEFITLVGYSTMLIVVVLTLKKGYYKYQMGQLAWTIAVIVITVVQVHSFTNNIFNGLFWFLYPVSLVICNDSMAYFCGLALGRRLIRRQFVHISPNKTWEGFIGACFCTMLFAAVFPLALARWQFLTCPCTDLTANIFQISCDLPEVFTPALYALPPWVSRLAGTDTVTLLPIQIHGLGLGAFASLVAPFGGLFASAIKRTYNLKDFSDLIPGHGGVFDRVDCQLIMGLAANIYFSTFIGGSSALSRPRILQLAAALSPSEQLELYRELGAALKTAGLLK